MTAFSFDISQSTFLPEEVLARRARRRFHAAMIAIAVIVTAVLGSSLAYTSNADRQVAKQFDAELAIYSKQAALIDVARRAQHKQQLMGTATAFAASLVDSVPRSCVLAELTNSAPSGVLFLDVSLESAATTSDHADLKLTGVADTDVQLSLLMSRLKNSRLLSNVNLEQTKPTTQNGRSSRQFQIAASLSPNAVVVAPNVH